MEWMQGSLILALAFFPSWMSHSRLSRTELRQEDGHAFLGYVICMT